MSLKGNLTSLSFCLFRNNRITAEGAVYLSKGLSINTSLQVLKVGQKCVLIPLIVKQGLNRGNPI